jgi:ribosomal protein S12 methylthiotransferase
MLRRMKRGGNREQYERMVERARELVPGIAVRTTFIVGFPGETEGDFEELVDFCESVEFDRVGVFTYSDEEDTEAFALDGKVDPEVAAERRDALMEIQADISRRRNERLVGSRVRVLMEGASEETELLLQGRMETQAPNIDGVVLVNDAGEEGRAPGEGEFVTVEITEAHDYDLVGRIV